MLLFLFGIAVGVVFHASQPTVGDRFSRPKYRIDGLWLDGIYKKGFVIPYVKNQRFEDTLNAWAKKKGFREVKFYRPEVKLVGRL